MRGKIGFIGLGQCGGNICSLFEHDFNCLYINTSKEDLSTLNTKYRFHIPDGEGCSHDRDKAIALIKKHHRKVLEEIGDKLINQKIIYLVFSAGGGTGSGVAPILIDLLNSTFPEKYFGCITVLPSDSELPKPHMNSFQCYKELSNIEKLGSVFTLDNNKVVDKFKINSMFYQKFISMLDIPNHTNIKGNIDNAELFKLLTTRGNIIISTCTNPIISNLTTAIIKSWEDSSIFADIEKDKQIAYMGLSLTNDINLQDLQKFIGVPFDVFQNFNRDMTVTILSGLSFPKTRINKILEKVNYHKETVKNNLLNSKTNKITDDLNFFDEINEFNKPSFELDLQSIDKILANY